MTPEQVKDLDSRAREIGAGLGWELGFVVAPNPEYVGLTAGPDRIFIVGPARLDDLAAHDVELTLDSLERGDHQIIADENGDPRLASSG